MIGNWGAEDCGTTTCGAVWIVYGARGRRGDLDARRTSSRVAKLGNDTFWSMLGVGVAALGDTNADGRDDIGVTAATDGERDVLAVVRGRRSRHGIRISTSRPAGPWIVDDTTNAINVTDDLRFTDAGDINRDGRADTAVVGQDFSAHVAYGGAFERRIDVSTLHPPFGSALLAPGPGHLSDWLSGAGDINGNGIGDFLTCEETAGGASVDRVVVLLGAADASGVTGDMLIGRGFEVGPEAPNVDCGRVIAS